MINESKLNSEIMRLKSEYASDLIILGHHYQRQEIINHSDVVGDSYYLAKMSASRKEAKYIVFCGVRFMAEAAAILCGPNQKVLHPDKDAGCPLADMADLDTVKDAWKEIGSVVNINDITPLTYINSSADLKAFCGMNEGLVCTSSNAQKAMEHSFSKRRAIFFFPDQHLGRNTSVKMGIKDDEVVLWKPSMPLGGNDEESLIKAKVILFDGYCHVHANFTKEDVARVRRDYKGVKIIVHPECKREVVDLCDEAGSTGFIVDYVKNAPKGSTIAVGTEINLVARLALENKDKNVIELKRSLCPNMFKITLEKLHLTLSKLDSFEAVKVEEEIKHYSRLALKRMLEV